MPDLTLHTNSHLRRTHVKNRHPHGLSTLESRAAGVCVATLRRAAELRWSAWRCMEVLQHKGFAGHDVLVSLVHIVQSQPSYTIGLLRTPCSIFILRIDTCKAEKIDRSA